MTPADYPLDRETISLMAFLLFACAIPFVFGLFGGYIGASIAVQHHDDTKHAAERATVCD